MMTTWGEKMICSMDADANYILLYQKTTETRQGNAMNTHDNHDQAAPVAIPSPMGTDRAQEIARSGIDYLKQVYALLAASLLLAVATGWVGMHSPIVFEHLLLFTVAEFGALILSFFIRNTATLFLFVGLSGLTLGPMIAVFINAGLSGAVGQALFLSSVSFTGLTLYGLTTRRDLSVLGGILFAGLLVVVVGAVVNLFLHASALSFAVSALGAVIFSGYIVYETQQYKMNPWAVPPSTAALSLYLNLVNLFIVILRLLGILGQDD